MTIYADIPPGVEDPDEWLANQNHARVTGWAAIDLGPILTGGCPPATPTIGIAPNSTSGLLYPGRRHSIVAESEAGKSWLALLQVAAEADRGRHLLYIDFEDDEHGFTDRALAIGIHPDQLTTHIHYYRPEAPFDSVAWSVLGQMLHDWAPTLVVVDGVTDGMGLHGLDPLNNRDVAAFSRRLIRPLSSTGAAIAALDHVTKSNEGRGRYALGGVHKLNDVNGAQYLLENRQPFGRGLTGKSGLFVGKDRPGYLRAQGRRSAVGYWIGDLVGESLPAGGLQLDLLPPPEQGDKFRPTVLMERVREALRGAPEPLPLRGILDRVQGKNEDIRTAVACLIDDGEVTTGSGPRNATLHTLKEAK